MFVDVTQEKERKQDQDTVEAEIVKEEVKTQDEEDQQEESKTIGKKKIVSFFSKRIEELEAKVSKYESQEKTLKDELNKKFLEAVKKKSEEAFQLIQDKEKEIEKKYSEKFEEKIKFIHESQLTELVHIFSRLEGVVLSSSGSKEVQNYLLGFKMFLTQFENLFASWNIEEISPNLNQEFDSEIMESLETTPVENDTQKNKILHVFSKGYKLHNRVIKLAQVKVGV